MKFKGKEYKFKINGLSVVDLNVSNVSAAGEVYHLRHLSDFAGTYEMDIVRVGGIVTLWIVAIMPVSMFAQEDSALPDRLLVGMVVVPPFAMKTTDGLWEGLSIELWQAVAQDLGVTYEVREYSLGQILEAVEKGDLDAVIASLVTEQREIIMDYSQPFLTSGSAIAVPADPPGSQLVAHRRTTSSAEFSRRALE